LDEPPLADLRPNDVPQVLVGVSPPARRRQSWWTAR